MKTTMRMNEDVYNKFAKGPQAFRSVDEQVSAARKQRLSLLWKETIILTTWTAMILGLAWIGLRHIS